MVPNHRHIARALVKYPGALTDTLQNCTMDAFFSGFL